MFIDQNLRSTMNNSMRLNFLGHTIRWRRSSTVCKLHLIWILMNHGTMGLISRVDVAFFMSYWVPSCNLFILLPSFLFILDFLSPFFSRSLTRIARTSKDSSGIFEAIDCRRQIELRDNNCSDTSRIRTLRKNVYLREKGFSNNWRGVKTSWFFFDFGRSSWIIATLCFG